MTTKFYTTQFDPQWLLNAANPPSGEIFNMPTAPGKTQTPSALLEVIDSESYDWLLRESQEGYDFIGAIRRDLARGLTPDQIYMEARRHMGYEREKFAQRLLQAARHLSRTQAG